MPPSGPPPASARPIRARGCPTIDADVPADVDVRVRPRRRTRVARPDAIVFGMALLMRGNGRRLMAALARNGSGELLLRGGLDRALRALHGFCRTRRDHPLRAL